MDTRNGTTFKEFWNSLTKHNCPPEKGYVYKVFHDNVLIYIGKTRDVRARMQSHWSSASWITLANRLEVEEYDSMEEAGEREVFLISNCLPKFNIKHSGLPENIRQEKIKRLAEAAGLPESEIILDNGYRTYVDHEGCWDTYEQASMEFDVTFAEMLRMMRRGEVETKKFPNEERVKTFDDTLEDFDVEDIEDVPGQAYKAERRTDIDELLH